MNINKIILRYYIDCFFLLFVNLVISFINILQLNCLFWIFRVSVRVKKNYSGWVCVFIMVSVIMLMIWCIDVIGVNMWIGFVIFISIGLIVIFFELEICSKL